MLMMGFFKLIIELEGIVKSGECFFKVIGKVIVYIQLLMIDYVQWVGNQDIFSSLNSFVKVFFEKDVVVVDEFILVG